MSHPGVGAVLPSATSSSSVTAANLSNHMQNFLSPLLLCEAQATRFVPTYHPAVVRSRGKRTVISSSKFRSAGGPSSKWTNRATARTPVPDLLSASPWLLPSTHLVSSSRVHLGACLVTFYITGVLATNPVSSSSSCYCIKTFLIIY